MDHKVEEYSGEIVITISKEEIRKCIQSSFNTDSLVNYFKYILENYIRNNDIYNI